MSELATVVSKLRPLLEEYSAHLKGAEERIRNNGTISQEICVKCSRKNISKVIKFGGDTGKQLASFLEWIRRNEIRGITSDGEMLAFGSTKNEVEGIEGTIPLLHIGSAIQAAKEKVLYDYRISITKLSKRPFSFFLKDAFSAIRPCAHTSDLSGEKYPALVTKTNETGLNYPRIETLWESPQPTSEYRLLCKECYERIDSMGCEESIRKQGFVFTHGCPTRRIIFQNLLEKHGIKHDAGTEGPFYLGNQLMMFLPELSVLVHDTHSDLTPTIEALKPNVLLAFGTRQELPRFIRFGLDVILFDPEKNSLVVFDKNVRVESSEERIIDRILSDLDRYSSAVRGKEHDKLVEAFRKVGEELGFITQAEMAQKGSRVDIVWLNREGKVEVAIEVETSAQWKKDIVTTWETSPKLAVILAHYKTEKGVEDITQYSLLQYMPHRLFFISYLQKKAYLIEKGDIIKSYDIKTAE